MALESGGISRGFGECGHHQVVLECGGHLQVALESVGISRWLWKVGASPGGIGELGHHQVALDCGGIS